MASPDPGARIRTSGDLGGLVPDDGDLVDGRHLAEQGEQLGLRHVLGNLPHEELQARFLLAASSLPCSSSSLRVCRRRRGRGGLLAVLRHCLEGARVSGGGLSSALRGSWSRSLARLRLVAAAVARIVFFGFRWWRGGEAMEFGVGVPGGAIKIIVANGYACSL